VNTFSCLVKELLSKLQTEKFLSESEVSELVGTITKIILFLRNIVLETYVGAQSNHWDIFAQNMDSLSQTMIDILGMRLNLQVQLHDSPRSRMWSCAAFELMWFCTEVQAIDFSQKFIKTCNKLKNCGEHSYSYVQEGKITKKSMAVVDPSIDRSRVTFKLGDAWNLDKRIGEFDVVLCANIIDRIPEPKKCVEQLHKLVKSNGILVFTTPYTWKDEYTWPSKWLGGFTENDKPVTGFSALSQILENHFELINQKDMPLMLREHSRKYFLCIPHGTVWKRK